jgi:hypothetical protein
VKADDHAAEGSARQETAVVGAGVGCRLTTAR